MTQNEFKIGDRVRSKVAIYAIPTGRSGVITAIMPDDRYKVRLDGEAEWHGWYASKDLELIESFDRKTAFLSELQALLRKYDAEICYREGDCELHIDLGNGNTFDRISYPFEYCDYDINDVGRLNLTADNIMDFDKE